MSKDNNRFNNRWNIFKENNTIAFVCVSIVAFNIVFIMLSALLISFLPENQGHSIGELIKLAFTLMVNPSGKYVYSEASISLIITTIVVLLGMISLTGGTVGIITSCIQSILERAANNKTNLNLKNHIVILNYNNKVPAIIKDYCFDDMANTFVTILATEDKKMILDEIDNMYKKSDTKKKFKNIIVRDGNPMSQIDLDKINIKDARTVLIMTPYSDTIGSNSEDVSFQVSKLFMFVTWYFSCLDMKEKANIVVETSNQNMEKMVNEYNFEHSKQVTVPVNYNEITGKMLAITAIMPSLNGVMRQLFSFEGVEIYIEDTPEDRSLVDEFENNATVLPLFDQDGKRIYVAEDEDEIGKCVHFDGLKKPLPDQIISPFINFEKEEIIIVGTNNKLPHIIESLGNFKTKYENDKMHVILAGTQAEEEELKRYYQDQRYTHILMPEKYGYIIVNDIYNPMNELGDATSQKADSIIFLSDDNVSNVHVDEKPLIYWTNLKKSIRSNKKVDVIVEILDSQNMSIIELKDKDQIIVSDDFLGHLYAQLGKTPERLNVLLDMITSDDEGEDLDDQGDFICVSVESFFRGVDEDLTFASKRELILWIYNATGGKVLPIGVVKESVPYIFSRTTGDGDDLDSTVLLGISDDQVYETDKTMIELKPEDELVVFVAS